MRVKKTTTNETNRSILANPHRLQVRMLTGCLRQNEDKNERNATQNNASPGNNVAHCVQIAIVQVIARVQRHIVAHCLWRFARFNVLGRIVAGSLGPESTAEKFQSL